MGEDAVAWTFVVAILAVSGGPILRGNLPTYRAVGGTFAAWLLLAIMAKASPRIAAAIAYVAVTTVILETAGDIGPQLLRFLGQSGTGGGNYKATGESVTAKEQQASSVQLRIDRSV